MGTNINCYYCGVELKRSGHRRLTWDHKVPKSKGGGPKDLVPACFICNQEKGTMSAEKFIALLWDRAERMAATLTERTFDIAAKELPKQEVSALQSGQTIRYLPELSFEDLAFLYEVGVKY